jgi:hypothetical protein
VAICAVCTGCCAACDCVTRLVLDVFRLLIWYAKTLILGIALHLRKRECIVLIYCHNYWRMFKAGDYSHNRSLIFITLFLFCLFLYACFVHSTRNTMCILCKYIMKYITFEFHFSSFNSAPSIATGITAKEYTGTATILLPFALQKHSLYRSLQLLKVLYQTLLHINTLLQSVKSATDVFASYFRSSAVFKLRVVWHKTYGVSVSWYEIMLCETLM